MATKTNWQWTFHWVASINPPTGAARFHFQSVPRGRISVSCRSLSSSCERHRGAMREISRGLSDLRERYPRSARKSQRIPTGCQIRCDPCKVVDALSATGGAVAPLRGLPQPPANLCQPSGGVGRPNFDCEKLRCAATSPADVPQERWEEVQHFSAGPGRCGGHIYKQTSRIGQPVLVKQRLHRGDTARCVAFALVSHRLFGAYPKVS